MPLLVEQVCRDVQPEQTAGVLAWIEQRRAAYDWPGNLRELVNVASVAAALAHDAGAIDDVLTLAADEAALGGRGAGTAFSAAKRAAVAAFERDYFTELVRRCDGNVSEMARQSGMERHHVRAYLRKYGIER